MTITCPHAQHNICQIATQLANKPVPLDKQACFVCSNQLIPFAPNRVTASIAIFAIGEVKDLYLLHMATDSVHLAGNTLNRYVHKWLKRFRINTASIQHSCGCDSMIRKMNDWGVEESLKHIDEIVDQLYAGLQLTYLSALAIPTTKPIIRRIVTKCLLNVHSLSH